MKCVCAALILSACATTAFAQAKSQQNVPKNQSRAEKVDPTIFSVQYSDVQAIVKMAKEAFPHLSIAADAQTNSLLVTGSKKEVQGFAGLLDRLEERAAEQAAKEETRKKLEKQERSEIKIFSLHYSRAETLATVVREICPTVRLTPDPYTNTLIASGSDMDLKIIEAILLRLDNSAEARTRTKSKIQALYPKTDARSMAKMLSELTAVKLTVDEERGLILVAGDDDAVKQVKELMNLLDAPIQQQKASTKPLKLRVVWLSSGERSTKPLTKDLEPIVGPLAKVGIADLGIVTQMLVDISQPDANFGLQGLVDDNSIQVSGERKGGDWKPTQLNVEIGLKPKSLKTTVTVESSVTLSPGQMVVLGATPMGQTNAVFVVQLVEGF